MRLLALWLLPGLALALLGGEGGEGDDAEENGDQNMVRLPKLYVNRNQVYAIGWSSGADMAIQMHVAFSSVIKGSCGFQAQAWHCGGHYFKGEPLTQLNAIPGAVVGGGSVPDLCADCPLGKTILQDHCKGWLGAGPRWVKTDELAQDAREAAERGDIDPVENLRHQNVYLLWGSAGDAYYRPGTCEKTRDFFRDVTNGSVKITYDRDTGLAHGVGRSHSTRCIGRILGDVLEREREEDFDRKQKLEVASKRGKEEYYPSPDVLRFVDPEVDPVGAPAPARVSARQAAALQELHEQVRAAKDGTHHKGGRTSAYQDPRFPHHNRHSSHHSTHHTSPHQKDRYFHEISEDADEESVAQGVEEEAGTAEQFVNASTNQAYNYAKMADTWLTTALGDNVYMFDQSEFFPEGVDKVGMMDFGYVYAPPGCMDKESNDKTFGRPCKLLLVTWGCGGYGPGVLFQQGYVDFADKHGAVLLYPRQGNYLNKQGRFQSWPCWDSYGLTGTNYAYKSGVQMTILKKMMDRIMGLDHDYSSNIQRQIRDQEREQQSAKFMYAQVLMAKEAGWPKMSAKKWREASQVKHRELFEENVFMARQSKRHWAEAERDAEAYANGAGEAADD